MVAGKLRTIGANVTENADLPVPWMQFQMGDRSLFYDVSSQCHLDF